MFKDPRRAIYSPGVAKTLAPLRATLGLLLVGMASAGIASAHAEPIQLVLPVDCQIGRTCAVQNYVDHSPESARDYRCGSLTYDGHKGTDFRLPTMAALRAGVDVLAAADGRVLRVRNGLADNPAPGDLSALEAGHECGNGVVIAHDDGWETQYCHMEAGSLRVKPGDRVAAGQPLGHVGLSGNTEFPHLHLTVRHNGEVVDPFAFGAPPGACGGGRSLWTASVRDALGYREQTLLNSGFAPGPVTMAQIESGALAQNPPDLGSAALVAYVRGIGLKAGDVQTLSIRGPDGTVLVDHRATLSRQQAQTMLFAGKKRPPNGWPAGEYDAEYRVIRDGKPVLEHRFKQTL